MTLFEDFVSRFEGVRKTSRGVMVCCVGPLHAHGDRHQSLHLQEGTDGRVLLHCFAGCAPEDICHALGISLKDLFAEALPNNSRKVQHIRRRKDADRELKYREYHKKGAAIDVVREAGRVISSAKNIENSAAWPDEVRDDILAGLADAYVTVWREEGYGYEIA